MAIKTPERYQFTVLPSSIDDYVSAEDPVRVYDAMIDAMDSTELRLFEKWNKAGNSPYDPKSMLKLLVYGYSYGWRSSRKLERALHHNLSFIWLVGGLKPDHKTIANFRKNNKDVLKKVLKQCAHICLELDLIAGNCLFVDGTKIRGAASINQTKSKAKWQKKLAEVDKRIEDLLAECEGIDARETGSLVSIDKELQDQKKLQSKISSLLDRMETEDRSKMNGTDPECINFRGRQGSHAGYNAQIVVDEKNGLIVSAEVVAESNDTSQFSNQISQAVEVLGKPCAIASGDAGYANIDNIKETVDKEIDVIVPSQKQSLHRPKEEPFGKGKFQYDADKNQYICPEGKILRYSHYSKTKGHYLYRMRTPSDCHQCTNFGICTKAQRGRAIIRLRNEALKEDLEARYESEQGQSIYKKRKEKVELPFGHIKRNLGVGGFLVKGLAAVNGEFSIMGSCFNIARMITLKGGVKPLINQLAALQT